MLAAYAFLVFATTIIGRKPFEETHFQPELFWSWRMWYKQKAQILANVIMFIPIGILTGLLWKWEGLIFAAGLSVVIEVLQLVTDRGLCEFDDVLHNVIGAAIGIGIVMLIRRILTTKERDAV